MKLMIVYIFGVLSLGTIDRAKAAQAVSQLLGTEGPVVTTNSESNCARILSRTETTISTLRDLYVRGILTIQDLIAIRDGHNPLEQKQSVNGQTYRDVVAQLTKQLNQNLEAQEQLDEMIEQTGKQISAQKIKTEETANLLLPMTMYHIPSGEFLMGDERIKIPERQVEVKSFYASNIPVTQWEYAFVRRDLPEPNPSQFKNGPNSAFVNIEGQEILMQPNNPVEKLKRSEVCRYIEVLNLWSQEDNPLIYKIISNHIKHAHIRLLTEPEWEYLARHGGLWRSGPYPDGITESNLQNYAWYKINANRSTHPVAERSPLIIFDHPFFDLLGNVWERVQHDGGLVRVLRGGSWSYNARGLRIAYRQGHCRGVRNDAIGFRLAEDPP